MNEQKDILSSCAGSGNPFKTPEAYFEGLEDRLLSRIAAEEQPATPARHPAWRIIKPALTLAAMFAVIFGMGYGVLSLTRTLGHGDVSIDVAGYATAEEEMIRPASLINYYQSNLAEETELDEETIVNYLATELSFSDLAEIYAQSY